MGQRSVYDPRDPWAFRNTWTGEIRNSYDDLWIWFTLIVGITLVALLFLIPILIHRYCRVEGMCPNWCSCFDRTLSVVKEMDNERLSRNQQRKEQKREYDRKFARPTAITYDVKRELRNKHETYRQYPVPHYDIRRTCFPYAYYDQTKLQPHRSRSLPRTTASRKVPTRYNIPKIRLHRSS
ncbi:unnamed protein product [Auanema sp. JU1783]|nr:unnamed protein product [Auanema sp. JU1783]